MGYKRNHTENTFIYALTCPISDNIRYIGKSDIPKARFAAHLRRKEVNPHKDNWIKSLALNGLLPKLEILDTVPKSEWEFWEKHYISLYRSWGVPLVNILDGGDGNSLGFIPWNKGMKNPYKPEVAEKIRETVRKKTQERESKILIKFNSGISKADLATESGVDIARIELILRRLGAVKYKPRLAVSACVKENIVDLFLTTRLKTSEIAKRLNINISTVSECIKKSGVDGRSKRFLRLGISDETRKKLSKSSRKTPNKGRWACGVISHNAKPVIQKSLQGKFIKEWVSAHEASVKLKINNIGGCLIGRRNKAGGFLWVRKNK